VLGTHSGAIQGESVGRGAPSSVLLALSDIKLAHSVFALPFALLGAFLGAPRTPGGRIDWAPFVGMLALVVLCMVFARTWAMLYNRLVDARFDRENPRTSGRAVASGRLSARAGWSIALASAACFVACASLFGVFFGNFWPAILSPLVLVWIAFYSLTKRFTWLCHVFLGGALAASPLAAALAVGGLDALVLPHGAPVWWIASMVVCWVAGFDVIYALQDMEFDRGAGLSSVPARFGWRRAAWISRVLHALAFASLVAAGLSAERLGLLYWAALVPVGLLLVYEHVVLARRGAGGLDLAFFTLNGVVSCVLGLAGCIDAAF